MSRHYGINMNHLFSSLIDDEIVALHGNILIMARREIVEPFDY